MNTQTRPLWLIPLVICSAGLFAAKSFADTVTVSTEIPTTGIAETGYAGFVEAQQFDQGSNFVLESVVIALTLDFVGTMAIENTDPDYATSFSLSLAWMAQLRRPEQTPLVDLEAARTRQGLLDPYDGNPDFGGFSGASFDVERTGVNSSILTADQADLALFNGDGTITLPISASFAPTVNVGSTDDYIADFWDITFDGDLFITYNYHVVPEPAWGYVIPLLLLLRRRGH